MKRLFYWLTLVVFHGQLGIAVYASELPEPGVIEEWRKLLAESARLYEDGRFTEAENILAKAVRRAEQFTPLDPRLPTTIHALGFLYQVHGNYPQAKACYLRAIHLWERIGPAQHKALSSTIDNLIGTYVQLHEYRAASQLMRLRLDRIEQGDTWEERATLLNMQAAMAFRRHHSGEAELLYKRSLALWEEHPRKEGKNVAFVLLNLSLLYQTSKRYEHALEAGARAVRILENSDPTVRPFLARALDNLAFILFRLNRLDEAEQIYARVLPIAEQALASGDPFRAQILSRYSMVLRLLHRTSEAKSLARDAKEAGREVKATIETIDVFELYRVAPPTLRHLP